MKNKKYLIAAIGLLMTITSLESQIILSKIIGHNMVLQRQKPVPIWGTASSGEKISVSFKEQVKNTVADASGKWQVYLDPMEASDQPASMTISGSNVIKLDNILVGEVWLCSGQSNMEFPMRRSSKTMSTVKGEKPSEDDLVTAKNPNVRIFLVNRKFMKPDPKHKGWDIAKDSALRSFSAVGYFFAKNVYNELHVPIGMISSAIPGSRIEPWIDSVKLAVSPTLKNGETLKPLTSDGGDPAKFYVDMIKPLIPFSLRGFLWYQGESGCYLNETIRYAYKFKTLIESWRESWGKDLPFYFVQIAPYYYSHSKEVHSDEMLAEFREAQSLALNLPNTGMVITTDLADNLDNIHPSYKWEVGRRLALWALNLTYGNKNIVYSGPMYKGMKIKGDKIEIEFTQTGTGLKSRDGKPLDWFTIAGEDGKFVDAKAVIKGNTVEVSSPGVKKPVNVRFAWKEVAQPNLINNEGFPAAPFRTNNPWVNLFQ